MQNSQNFLKNKTILCISEYQLGGEWNAFIEYVRGIKKSFQAKISYIGLTETSSENILYGEEVFTHKVIVTTAPKKRIFGHLRHIFGQVVSIYHALPLDYHKYSVIIVLHYCAVFAILLKFGPVALMRCIFMFHGWKRIFYPTHFARSYKNRSTILLERIALALCRRIIVPSEAQVELINSELSPLKKEIFVVPNRVQKEFFQPIKRKHTSPVLRVLYSGSIIPLKGLYILVQAVYKIRKIFSVNVTIMYPEATVDKNYLSSIISYIHSHKMDHIVAFHPSPGLAKRVKLYQQADITVLPSIFEVQPLSILESYASYTPAISTNVGDVGNLITQVDKNLLLSQPTVQSLVYSLRYFHGLSSKEKSYRRMKSNQVAKYVTGKKLGKERFPELAV